MLIPNQLVKMKWHPRNKEYYENLGYIYTKMGDGFDVKIEDLTIGAKPRVKIQCDYCGQIYTIKYQNYVNRYSPELKDACDKCKTHKVIESNIQKYGVSNVFELNEIKEKSKQTCMEKYGEECYSQTDECKERCRQTCMKRYGRPYYMQTKEFWERYTALSLEKRGCKYPTQDKNVVEKIRQTNNEKYGGIGLASPILAPIIKNTMIQKYGGFGFGSSIISEKAMKSYCEHGNAKTSKPQLELFNKLKTLYKKCELNYPCGNCFLDCVIFIDGIKIDIEYDGVYWHQDENRDRRRDYYIKSRGYKILRIKGTIAVPTEQQLIDTIDYLVKDNHSFAKIELDI